MNDTPLPDLPDDYEARIRQAHRQNESPAGKALSFLLLAGGVTVAAAVIVPGRTAGASRTARLEWQRRNAEITRTVEAPQPPEISVQP
jgi:hypothetical protein